jgi:Tfp pilus assembly protein PilN
MIKVNLLREHAPRGRKIVVAPTVSRTGIVAAIIFVLTAAVLGACWYYLNNQISTLTASRDKLRAENARLEAIKRQIGEYEKIKQQLQGRIDVIERLKQNQSSPVLLLNHVIQSIPRNSSMWLTQLEQKEDRVQIVGFSPKADAIPDFISNLAAGGFFTTVDLDSFEDQKEAAKFSLSCISKRNEATE